ncbi:MAG TPA: Ig-like domain-containing protein [Candidatus Limnocylindria bacterium]|nr:Ig-like domain-containing protein [Candidatus Limnocylindria bacterium]
MRAVVLRYLAVVGIGLALLAGVLFYASTVDGRAPEVERIALTLHASDDDRLALTTTSIEVQFSEAVDRVSAEAAFRIEPQTAGEFSWSGLTLRFTPEQRLPLETEFAVVVEPGVVDEAGNRMTAGAGPFDFRTVGPPRVASTQPDDGAFDVPLDQPIVLEFTSLMDTALVEEALSVTPALDFEATWSAERLALVAQDGLDEATRYTVTIGTDARDSAGIPLESAFAFSFQTTGSPLSAELVFPADESEGVATITPVGVVLDRELDEGADLDDLFSIEPEVAGTLDVTSAPGAAGLDEPGDEPEARILRFVPSGPLAPNTTYRVTLLPGLAAADGTELSQPLEWRFTTGAPLGTLSNQVVFLSDRSGVANLWAMNPDGSGQRQVTAELSPVTDYAVAPDGRRVVVGDGAQLVLQNADGSEREILTQGGVLEFDPAWAPDGAAFAFGRAELDSGAGLGIWTRAADGSDEQQVEMPVDATTPTPTASPSAASEQEVSVLRAPRYAPDGSALAFVDAAGRVGVLELPAGRLTTAPWVAVTPPLWLEDSTALLVNGLPDGPLPLAPPGQPVPLLDPTELPLAATALEDLDIGRLYRGAVRVTPLGAPPGATRPAVGADELVYVILSPDHGWDAGALRLSPEVTTPSISRGLLVDGGAPVASATFGLEERTVVVARSADEPLPSRGGIWLVDLLSGRAEQIAEDGWQPRWLP